MKLRTHHLAASLFAGAIALSSLAWLGLQAPTAFASCGTGATISMVAPPGGATLSGSQVLNASTSGSSMVPTSVTILISAPSQQVLGQVTGPAGTYNWSIPWDSRTVVDGSYQFMAIAHYGTNTAFDCPSSPVQYNVLNSTAPTQNSTLTASIAPSTWQAIPAQKAPFNVTGVYTNQFGTQYPITTSSGATFAWSTNAGTLSAANLPTATLTAGPTAGTYTLAVMVSMNGLTTHATSSIKISTSTTAAGSSPTPSQAPPSPTPSPVPTGTTTPVVQLSPQQVQQLQATPTIFRPTTATNSNPIVSVQTLGCLQQQLGSSYVSISNGASQPSTVQRLYADQCFSGSNRIPSKLAPVEPSRIDDVPTETTFVKLDSVKNETISNSKGTKVAAILLTGTGEPNSSVFLYFFSDPMVLRAETDSQGKWSYVLQNPLIPGDHKVYAVAQKDSDNFVRTPSVPIAIAAASTGSQDGSLIIENSWQPAQITYAAGAGVMVILGIVLLFRLRRHAKPLVTTSGSLVLPATPVPPATAIVQPVAPLTPAPPVEPPAPVTPVVTVPISSPAATVPTPPTEHDAKT